MSVTFPVKGVIGMLGDIEEENKRADINCIELGEETAVDN